MRYVIRDAETEKNMDCFETIRGCVDRIREYQEEDKKNGCYKEYEVYDTKECTTKSCEIINQQPS